MKIYIIYTDEKGEKVKEEIDDMYWFEENMVHDLRPQCVNGYGTVRFEYMPILGESCNDLVHEVMKKFTRDDFCQACHAEFDRD